MNESYYREYYHLERANWWFKVRAQIIMQHLKKVLKNKNEIKILNIGAATGRTTELLSQFGKVISLEYDKECCEFVKTQLKIDIINGSILELPFENNTFDLVCAFDVIEHVENDAAGVKEMKRVCKPGGIICITVPAFMQLWSHHDVVNEHYRRYAMSGLLKLFKDDNGHIIYKTYFNSILFIPIYLFRLLSKIIPDKFIRKGAGSDFTVFKEESLVNKVFYSIFNFEKKLMAVVTFPFGVSLLLSYSKIKIKDSLKTIESPG
jgi:SAM-dependent methyltransferase